MEKIGSGSYGNVYHDKENNEAVKTCYYNNPTPWIGNLREMDILQRCKGHPYIVNLNGIFFDNEPKKIGNHYNDKLVLRLRYYPSNLQNVLHSQKEGLEVAKVRAVMAQLLTGLEYLHANRIIHRDLKPDNILMDDNLGLAICDFGMSDIGMKYQKTENNVTAPLYRAPEVFKGCRYSTEVDIWAAGMMMFNMISGEYPYEFPSEKEKVLRKKIEALRKSRCSTKDKEAKSEQKIAEEIDALEKKICDEILAAIATIDIKKTFTASSYSFRKLLIGLLDPNPSKRLTARQALEDPFFNSVRDLYINPARKAFPPEGLKLRKIRLEKIDERLWMKKYTMNFVATNNNLSTEILYPMVFHGLDLFQKYLEWCRQERIYSKSSEGRYLNENETHLHLYTCFYIAHKYYAVTCIPYDIEDFFPEELITDNCLKKAEEFEEFLITSILDFKIFEYTLYEITEEFINSPNESDYYKVLKDFLNLTLNKEKEMVTNYRSLYREGFYKTTVNRITI